MTSFQSAIKATSAIEYVDGKAIGDCPIDPSHQGCLLLVEKEGGMFNFKCSRGCAEDALRDWFVKNEIIPPQINIKESDFPYEHPHHPRCYLQYITEYSDGTRAGTYASEDGRTHRYILDKYGLNKLPSKRPWTFAGVGEKLFIVPTEPDVKALYDKGLHVCSYLGGGTQLYRKIDYEVIFSYVDKFAIKEIVFWPYKEKEVLDTFKFMFDLFKQRMPHVKFGWVNPKIAWSYHYGASNYLKDGGDIDKLFITDHPVNPLTPNSIKPNVPNTLYDWLYTSSVSLVFGSSKAGKMVALASLLSKVPGHVVYGLTNPVDVYLFRKVYDKAKAKDNSLDLILKDKEVNVRDLVSHAILSNAKVLVFDNVTGWLYEKLADNLYTLATESARHDVAVVLVYQTVSNYFQIQHPARSEAQLIRSFSSNGVHVVKIQEGAHAFLKQWNSFGPVGKSLVFYIDDDSVRWEEIEEDDTLDKIKHPSWLTVAFKAFDIIKEKGVIYWEELAVDLDISVAGLRPLFHHYLREMGVRCDRDSRGYKFYLGKTEKALKQIKSTLDKRFSVVL